LHCGQYLGELDETTHFRQLRNPPPSTVRADQTLFADYAQHSSSADDYQPPRKRQWPFFIAASLIGGIVLLIFAGLIAMALIRSAGGVSVDLPNNNRLTVLATPIPQQPALERDKSPATPEPTQGIKVKQTAEPPTAIREQREAIQSQAPTPPQQRTFTIVNRQFVVPAGHFVSFRFVLTESAHVVGQFQAYGGHNDIAVAIMSEDEFVNYSNGGYYRAYYNSGYITSDNPTIALPAGTYYLTFDDRAALIMGKTVVAQFVVSR